VQWLYINSKTSEDTYCSLSLSLCLSAALKLLVGSWPLFSFLILYTVGLLRWGISLLQGLYLYTEKHKHNIRTQTSMPRVVFEPTTPVFERAKTVHALDCAATVTVILQSDTVNTPHCLAYGEWGFLVALICQLCKKILTDTQYDKVKSKR
jgi:hypothetical protein